MTLGGKGLKHLSDIIICDLRLTSDGETRVGGDGPYFRYLYLPRVSDLYELKSRFLIYNSQGNHISYKTSITLPVIKSPFEFAEYRLKVC